MKPLGKAGDAFLLPRGAESIPHLHAVVLASDPATGECIIVNFTTKRRGTEQTLVLEAGDHPFIHHETCARFDDAGIVRLDQLNAAEAKGLVVRQPSFKPAVLKRIQDGLLKSSFTPKIVKEKFYLWQRAAGI
jgi:hypothetical protein